MSSERVRRTEETTGWSGLTSIPGKVMEGYIIHYVLDTISIKMEDKKVIREVGMDSAKGNHT